MTAVESSKRFDCFISFHGSQRLQPLGFQFYPEYSTLREFSPLLSAKLRLYETRFPSVFLDSERLRGRIDDLFDAILQLRGGGVALVLLTLDYFKSSYCLAELRSFLQLASLPAHRNGESIQIRLVSLEPDEQYSGGRSGVEKILQEIQLLAADEVLRPFVEGMSEHVITTIDHSRTADGAAQEIAAKVKSYWDERGDNCPNLGGDDRISFVDMQRFFVPDDRFDLMEQLSVDGDDNIAVRRIMQHAVRNKTISYRDVELLLRACHFCRQRHQAMAAVNAYKRKWCPEDWSWSAQTRESFTLHLTDARNAMKRDKAAEVRMQMKVIIHRLDSTRAPSSMVTPAIPRGLKFISLARTDTLDSAREYPVLRVNRVTFWPLGYVDNRNCMAIMAVDERGAHLNTLEKRGARYICDIKQDEHVRETIFVGQSGAGIRMPWGQLMDIADRFSNGRAGSESEN